MPGQSLRTRTWAAKAGWHGPDVWEYVDIDDQNADPSILAEDDRPDEILVERVILAALDKNRPTIRLATIGREVDRHAIIFQLAGLGYAAGSISSRVNVAKSKVEKLLDAGRVAA